MTIARLGTAPETPESLGHVVESIAGWIDRLGWIWVEAQVIEVKRRAAPTQFLTLRDTARNISAALTITAFVLDAAGPITEGTTVIAHLKPRVYVERGSMSFECDEIRIAGEGRLLAMLEQLKRKLQAEGLFSPTLKKPLPFLPGGIGLITGANSAAERDVKSNVLLRWPNATIVTRHALMQGPQSAADVSSALNELDTNPAIDVIIIARGGGSLEDLLPFSDERLIRAVSAARTPVVSAIGHEPDTPILDFVADLRASTPTDAAKRIVPDAAAEHQLINTALTRLHGTIQSRLRNEQSTLDQLRSRPVLTNPLAGFVIHAEQLSALHARLNATILRIVANERTNIDTMTARMHTLSPQATLERGYAILTTPNTKSITSVSHVKIGDTLHIHLADGQLGATVKEK
ncbi:MAG: exodeoxyribonuclease VII large subunit [Propionibacteriaceae bacterium]|jgi:exodeoxyribonuclease VII large subunit|nr:exodeoxyribonuclease VII large subunit [Propionibacteriaceae bacterium]